MYFEETEHIETKEFSIYLEDKLFWTNKFALFMRWNLPKNQTTFWNEFEEFFKEKIIKPRFREMIENMEDLKGVWINDLEKYIEDVSKLIVSKDFSEEVLFLHCVKMQTIIEFQKFLKEKFKDDESFSIDEIQKENFFFETILEEQNFFQENFDLFAKSELELLMNNWREWIKVVDFFDKKNQEEVEIYKKFLELRSFDTNSLWCGVAFKEFILKEIKKLNSYNNLERMLVDKIVWMLPTNLIKLKFLENTPIVYLDLNLVEFDENAFSDLEEFKDFVNIFVRNTVNWLQNEIQNLHLINKFFLED